MDKKIVLTVVGVVLLLLGGLGYAYYANSEDNEADSVGVSDSETSTDEQNVDESATAGDIQPGKYVDYSDEALVAANGEKLLFFHASWCPQCRSIEASIEEGGLPDGVTVLKVDYDSNQALRQKYGVTIQTTFVKVDDEGNKIDSYVAYQEPTFASVERELLQ